MQITSDRDRVPRARRPRRRRGGEDGSRGECNIGRSREGDEEDEMKQRRRDGRGGRSEGRWRATRVVRQNERETQLVLARIHACVCLYVYAKGDSPHCDCYTHGRNVPSVCRLMPTRNQTRTTLILLFALVPATEQQVAQPSTCPLVCRPPYIHTYIHARRTAVYSLYAPNRRGREREREIESNHG